MEFSVRYVRIGDEAERPVLGLRGAKSAHCVLNELDQVRAVEISLKDFDRSALTMFHGEPYPVTRYLQEIERYKKNKPATVKADFILSLAYAGHPELIDEEALGAVPDELPDDGECRSCVNGKCTTGTGCVTISNPPAKPEKRAAKAKIPPRGRVSPAPGAKAAAIASPKRGRGRPPGGGEGLISKLAVEIKCDPAALRKACRAANMRAPYTEDKAIRAAWKKHGK